jgi:hypothetical protein
VQRVFIGNNDDDEWRTCTRMCVRCNMRCWQRRYTHSITCSGEASWGRRGSASLCDWVDFIINSTDFIKNHRDQQTDDKVRHIKKYLCIGTTSTTLQVTSAPFKTPLQLLNWFPAINFVLISLISSLYLTLPSLYTYVSTVNRVTRQPNCSFHKKVD